MNPDDSFKDENNAIGKMVDENVPRGTIFFEVAFLSNSCNVLISWHSVKIKEVS